MVLTVSDQGQFGQLESRGEVETLALGAALGRLLRPGHVVGLTGGLGAGKTRVAAGVARGMQVPESVYVSSPTFTLINEYPGLGLTLVHMDYYRLDDPEQLVELGVDEYLGGDAACVVEWFDRFPEAFPRRFLRVFIDVTGDCTRQLRLEARGDDHRELGRSWCAAWGRERALDTRTNA